jgi:Flp pilus assembly protein TadB
MSSVAAAVAWGLVAAVLPLVWPPAGRRPRRGRRASAPRPLHRLGLLTTAAGARALGRPTASPGDPSAVGAGVALAALAFVALPGAWPVAAVLASLPPLLSRLRRARARGAATQVVLDELPEVIDLLGLAVGAGLTAPLAVAAVGRRGRGDLAGALADATTAAAHDGRRLPDVLDEVPARLGPPGDPARPLVAALADACRHGTALGPSLERLAAEARTARRHRAEERARRVPVLLLFPLVTCTLPALGLLTIAPLAVGALRDLRA